jgi:hypothetical protein
VALPYRRVKKARFFEVKAALQSSGTAPRAESTAPEPDTTQALAPPASPARSDLSA